MKQKSVEKNPSPCNCLNLRRASLTITKKYDEMLAPVGLTISQFALLRYLKHIGPISVSDLASAMRLDRTTLVRNVRPLESEGLVADVSPKGTRNRRLQLTGEGTARLIAAMPLWNDAQTYIEQQLGKENLQNLTSLLSMIEGL